MTERNKKSNGTPKVPNILICVSRSTHDLTRAPALCGGGTDALQRYDLRRGIVAFSTTPSIQYPILVRRHRSACQPGRKVTALSRNQDRICPCQGVNRRVIIIKEWNNAVLVYAEGRPWAIYIVVCNHLWGQQRLPSSRHANSLTAGRSWAYCCHKRLRRRSFQVGLRVWYRRHPNFVGVM